MRKKGDWSEATYTKRVTEVRDSGGSATFEGEQRAKEGKPLDPLVDPGQGKYAPFRESNSLLVPDGSEFVLPFGVAMPKETDFDTTGSMGGNVDVAFKKLPNVQALLVQGSNAVLKRYHTQIATGIIQDRGDRYPYLRSMFEPDNEVERQMGLLVPERDGGDAIEDYQLSLFAAAYLSKTSITKYGLRGYYFIAGDQRGRDHDRVLLERVFGSGVLAKALGTRQSLPSLTDTVNKALQDWHLFYLQVNDGYGVKSWWTNLLGEERVISLPRTEDIAEVEACIIGLTEGVIDLKNAAEFLISVGVSNYEAVRIVEAVSGIPVGLQRSFPNFDKIPMAGARFKSREDIWPIGSEMLNKPVKSPKPKASSSKKKKDYKI